MSKVSAFIKDESGATAIEYGLIAAGISVGQCDRYNPERQVPISLDPAQVTHSMWLDRKKPPSPAAFSFLPRLS